MYHVITNMCIVSKYLITFLVKLNWINRCFHVIQTMIWCSSMSWLITRKKSVITRSWWKFIIYLSCNIYQWKRLSLYLYSIQVYPRLWLIWPIKKWWVVQTSPFTPFYVVLLLLVVTSGVIKTEFLQLIGLETTISTKKISSIIFSFISSLYLGELPKLQIKLFF